MLNNPNQATLSHKPAARPAHTLVLLLALIVLQSCDLPFGQAGSSAGPTPTLGPDDFSLCQYLGLASPTNEKSSTGALPATPPVQSTEFTGKYTDTEFIPIYPGSVLYEPSPFRMLGPYNDLGITTSDNTTAVIKYYADTLTKNNWLPAGNPLPEGYKNGSAARNGPDTSAEYLWSDPANALPWHMSLRLNFVPMDGNATVVELKYKRLPDLNKNLPVFSGASNIKSSCSENFVINSYKLDKSYKASVLKSYVAQGSPEQITDYYSTMLPQYGWIDDYGTFNGTLISPSGAIELSTHLEISTSPADGGGTKVELAQSVTRYIIQPIDSPLREITPTPAPK